MMTMMMANSVGTGSGSDRIKTDRFVNRAR
jgi:hypothetical protein